MSRSYPSRPPRAGQILLALVCAAGVLAGAFLLLCFLGVLSPARISQQVSAWLDPQPEAVSAAAPAQGVPAAQPEEEAGPLQTVFLPLDQLDQAEALAQGADGLVLPMKTDDGALGYVSAIDLAADAGTSWAGLDRNQTLRALNDTPGLYTVAQVSCLRDEALVQADPALALQRVSGSAWRDEEGLAWLDPTDTQVQSYLAGVCQELAQLGFDEILLTNCAYPTQGAVETLATTGARPQALQTLCRRLQGALADYDVTLSVQGQADAAQEDPPSGQTSALLATFGRVWAQQDDQQALAVFQPCLLPTP